MGHPQTASPSFKGKKAKSTLSGLVSILQNDERFQVFISFLCWPAFEAVRYDELK